VYISAYTAPEVGVAVAVKSGVALALPSTTAVPTVAVPLAPVMDAGAVQPVIWPSEIAPIAIIAKGTTA